VVKNEMTPEDKNTNPELDDFISAELEKAKERRDAAMKEAGVLPFLTLEKGMNEFTLLPEVPATRWSSFGKEQYCFKVEQDGTDKVWTVTINSPFSREVLDLLRTAPCEATVMKSGSGKDTRYEFI